MPHSGLSTQHQMENGVSIGSLLRDTEIASSRSFSRIERCSNRKQIRARGKEMLHRIAPET